MGCRGAVFGRRGRAAAHLLVMWGLVVDLLMRWGLLLTY